MRSIIQGVIITVAVTALNSTAAKKEAEPYKVDAFTSATSKHTLIVDSGWVYRDRAVLYWVELLECEYDVNAYYIRWGTQPGVFTDTLHLLDHQQGICYEKKTTNTATITGLTENTEYYAQFYRDYKNIGYITDFRFNTPPLPRYNVIHPRPLRLRSAESVTGVDLYSIDGRLLRHIAVDRSTDLSNIWSSLRLSGLYVVKYSGDYRVIGSEKVLFGN